MPTLTILTYFAEPRAVAVVYGIELSAVALGLSLALAAQLP